MIRPIAALALVLLLGSCGGGGGAPAAAPRAADARESPDQVLARLSAQNAGDTRVARNLFGAVPGPSAQESRAIGFYSRGCLAGAVEMPETGATWQAMRLSRNRNWGTPELIGFLQDLSRFAATQPGWQGLYIGDLGQPRGGPALTGHASHQVGLDADIWMLPPARLNLSRDERESISSIAMDRQGGAFTNANWTPQHEAILRQAAMDPRVERIFVFAGAKVAMCANATGDRSWLSKIRPLSGHNTHFHVRLACPAGDPTCVAQDPVPAGDGCAEAQEWVNNILNPPPPDPDAPPPPPPRAPLTMGELPAQCRAVLDSN
ncbi:MAG: penicillin-insensitive murein endopeptidase [Rubellimicrobium sp.]|nr:penicillin-insensitive murein endopeptidase [Rubellimicrobium sp.]